MLSQFLGSFFEGLKLFPVLLSSTLFFEHQLSDLHTKIIAAIIGVPIGVVIIFQIVKKIIALIK